MVAAVFGADQKMIAELLISVPESMEPDTLADQVVSLARVHGLLQGREDEAIHVAMRPADEDDRDAQLYARSADETLH